MILHFGVDFEVGETLFPTLELVVTCVKLEIVNAFIGEIFKEFIGHLDFAVFAQLFDEDVKLLT
jgi:hypothetical protein